jgi:Uma2 family endonuclease
MAAVFVEKTYTVAEYLQWERQTGEKHAFYNGKIEPMAGGSIAHNRVARNIFGLLFQYLRDKPEFELFGSDQKIYLPRFNFYVYPDAVVVAGHPIESAQEADAIVNPLLIVETLSNSTERYDRGQKFVEYQSLPSFQEYILLRQDMPEAYAYFREAPDLWRSTEQRGLDATLLCRSIGISIPMAELYHKVFEG